MSNGKYAPRQHIPGYTGHVPQAQHTYGITFGRASQSALTPIRSPTPFTYAYGDQARTRTVTATPGSLPGPGFSAFLGKENVQQGTVVDLPTYYKSLAVQEAEMKTVAAKSGLPMQAKKKTRNVSNVEMGDRFFWSGKHMFQTSNQEAYPDIAKIKRQSMPYIRVAYSAVEKDAAEEARKMIALKSHGQFADMHKAFLEYDKDRSGTLDRDELAQICYRFHIGDGDPKVIQALIDAVDVDGSGEVDYDEFAGYLGSHMRGSKTGTA